MEYSSFVKIVHIPAGYFAEINVYLVYLTWLTTWSIKTLIQQYLTAKYCKITGEMLHFMRQPWFDMHTILVVLMGCNKIVSFHFFPYKNDGDLVNLRSHSVKNLMRHFIYLPSKRDEAQTNMLSSICTRESKQHAK